MSIKARVKHLEKKLSLALPEVFLYRVIIGECKEGETPPPVGVIFHAGGEAVRCNSIGPRGKQSMGSVHE